MRFDDGEQAILVIRKHWLPFAAAVFGIAVLAIIPFVLALALPSGSIPLSQAIAGPVIAFGYFTWLLLLWLLLFSVWTRYYLDIWVVTNTRIIDINQKGLFNRELVSTLLEKVQEVTVETEGLFATLLNYGDLKIHTAGEDGEFRIQNAMRPNRARQMILDAHAALSHASDHI